MVSFKLPSSGKAIADLTVLPTVHKSRKPKFELHLKIYDLNNVPLVSGVSSVKWHLPHSIHGEHRGRTHKRPIANHRVEYSYGKIIPLRLIVDRNNRLSDYPIEFEITQEFETYGAGRDEKIILGKVALNLAEYVAESEAILRDTRPGTPDSRRGSITGFDIGSRDSPTGWHARKRSSLSTKGTVASLGTSQGTIDSATLGTSGPGGAASTAGSSTASLSTSGASLVEDGVIRRYLMQVSKINSTLKISILMVQVDGERNYVAPPLKSAPVFGGITGIMASGEVMSAASETNLAEDPDDSSVGGVVSAMLSSSASKGHETAEIQDVYRRALAASWACQPGELPADECIEDIFSGGDGFSMSRSSDMAMPSAIPSRHHSGAKPRGGLPAAGNALGSVLEGPGWSPSSPTRSSINERDEEDDAPAPSRTSSGGKKYVPRILPKLGPIRRKTLPLRSASGNSSSHKAKDKDSSSGEDGGAGGGGGGSGNTSGSNTNQDEEDGDFGPGSATLRPSDIRKFRGQPISASSSSSALAGMHLTGREDSGLSDRTVTPRADFETSSSAPRSSRSSPGPQLASFGHRRDDSFENAAGVAAAAATAAASRAGANDNAGRGDASRSGGRVPSGSRQNSGNGSGNGSGSGHDEQARKVQEVHEFEVRDDYVAWQLPGSIAASS